MPDDFESRLEREKLDAMKELAYGASHEINNPLANISARAQTLLRDEKQPDRRYALEAIRQQAMRAHEMISDLMLFARPPALVIEQVNLVSLLGSVAEQLTAECERCNVRLVLQLPDAEVTIARRRPAANRRHDRSLPEFLRKRLATDGTIEITLQ